MIVVLAPPERATDLAAADCVLYCFSPSHRQPLQCWLTFSSCSTVSSPPFLFVLTPLRGEGCHDTRWESISALVRRAKEAASSHLTFNCPACRGGDWRQIRHIHLPNVPRWKLVTVTQLLAFGKTRKTSVSLCRSAQEMRWLGGEAAGHLIISSGLKKLDSCCITSLPQF